MSVAHRIPVLLATLPFALSLLPVAGVGAQTPSDVPRLYTAGLGDLSRRVDTDDAMAQAWFDQGIQLMYAFAVEEGLRSFQEASGADPGCAMCAWGEAWAWGPYLNGPMQPEDEPAAHEAAQRAVERARDGGVSPVEQALIDAMAVRYAPQPDEDGRAARDSAYARAMGEVYAAHPRDLEAGTLYGEALMLLEPRRGTWPLDKPSVQRIHRVLEETLARDLSHPGACHLYVHATESTPAAGKAEPCAELLGTSIPGASHINHMPSHTYNRIGRWGDAVRANQMAWHSDQKAAVGEGFAIYPSHNLHMLLFAASMDGQGAVAIQAGKDYGKLMDGGQFYHALALLRFGRFDEVLAVTEAPENEVFLGLWGFARGYAHLRSGAPDSARVYLEDGRRLVRERGEEIQFRGHTGTQLLGVVNGILEAEILRSEGRTDDALDALEAAVALEDDLRYDEPEPLNFSARHWLGALLLEADRPAEAEAVYRAALADHPRNGWSLFGLAEALDAQGRPGDALMVRRELEESWARADVWIQASRF
ncbi:MAG TPA: tetratricopeptide repeat protein [Longimicrobiales bacterium]|nr:tetratricopeptide repeat protein [Longimicrobiales bacterium]